MRRLGDESLEVVRSSPDYATRWKMEVPASEALAIVFAHGSKVRSATTGCFPLPNGGELLVDRSTDGVVTCIGIV